MGDSSREKADRAIDRETDPIVAEFIRLVDQGAMDGQAPDLEAFVAKHPESLRAHLREQCHSYLDLSRMLAQVRPQTHASASTGIQLDDPMVGKVLGAYRLERKLGEGGMGVVYLAQHLSLDRKAAIKILPAIFAAKSGRPERFDRESRAPAKLDHPSIVRIYEAHEDSDLHWYAMEFVPGKSLQDLFEELRRVSSSAEAIAAAVSRGWITRMAEIVAAVAEALHYAHQKGVVHRDIKPHNLLIDPNGTPRIIDFGLAIERDGKELTRSGQLVGSFHYMSPEQIGGRESSPRSDLYSLGVVLYEALTLRRPFDGATRERVLSDITSSPPRPLRKLNSRVPRDLETICLKALEKKPEHRYASAADFARDLRHFLNHEAIEAVAPPLWRRAAFKVRQKRALVGGFVVGAIAVSVALLWKQQRDRSAALPSITVHGRPEDAGARVFARWIDVEHNTLGRTVELGRLPVEHRPFEPGYWRIVVKREGFGFTEMTRWVTGGDTTLFAWIRETSEVTASMVSIRAGEFIYGMPLGYEYFLNQQKLTLPTFFIDDRELTIAEYRKYLAALAEVDPVAREGATPRWMTKYDYDPKLDRFPMIGVTWLQATQCAEYFGKRLPTMHEWEKAARGNDGRRYSWPASEEIARDPRLPKFIEEPYKFGDSDSARREWQQACDQLRDVDDDPTSALSLFALKHTLDNVSEWSESMRLVLVDGKAVPDPSQRYVKGASWCRFSDFRREIGLALVDEEPADTAAFDRGLRCAKSDHP